MYRRVVEGSIEIGSTGIKAMSIKKKNIKNIMLKIPKNLDEIELKLDDPEVFDMVQEIVRELKLKGKIINLVLSSHNFFVKRLELNSIESPRNPYEEPEENIDMKDEKIEREKTYKERNR